MGCQPVSVGYQSCSVGYQPVLWVINLYCGLSACTVGYHPVLWVIILYCGYTACMFEISGYNLGDQKVIWVIRRLYG